MRWKSSSLSYDMQQNKRRRHKLEISREMYNKFCKILSINITHLRHLEQTHGLNNAGRYYIFYIGYSNQLCVEHLSDAQILYRKLVGIYPTETDIVITVIKD